MVRLLVTVDLVVAGKLAIDELSFQGNPSQPVLGGAAAHVAIAAALSGSSVAIVSTIGDDFPLKFLRMLEAKGIDLSGLKRVAGRSSHFWADFAKDGSMNSYRLHFGVGNKLSLRSFSSQVKNAHAIHLGILPPHLQRTLIKQVHGQGKLLSMTTIFHQAQTLRDQIIPQLPLLNILFLNAKEAAFLSQKNSNTQAITTLGESVPIVVVTLGPEGCMVSDHGRIFHVQGYQSTEVDSTGAGDSFAGAFIANYLHNKDLKLAAKWGNAAGSVNVQGIGCTSLLKATQNTLKQLVNSST